MIPDGGDKLRIKLDTENESLYFRLAEGEVVECEEISNGVILDYDEDKRVIGIEVANNGGEISSKELSNIKLELAEA